MKNKIILEKKKSLIDGIGIFSTDKIKKGVIFYIVPLKSVVSVPTPKFAHIGDNKYVNDEIVLNWINHSCDPNAILDISTENLYVGSLRDILSGEEITCEYNQTENDGIEVLCNCGNVRCKGRFLRIE